ncbi:hypothetical protein M6B38_343585 [Iris pallida]|uniref:Uncharacterized protein n=1 Tax=Iris pallida TaxID=29817 RepID=A0AAX6GV59_IRIPA|nr:hypothetical protein M6B38_343585 [Iris pallida]
MQYYSYTTKPRTVAMTNAGTSEQPAPSAQEQILPSPPQPLPPTMTFDGTPMMAMFQQFMEAQNQQVTQFREAQSQQAAQFRATIVDVLMTREPAPPVPPV